MNDHDRAVRLDAIKLICRTEGHRWIEVGTYGEAPFRRAMCGRGCGMYRRELWHGSSATIDQVAAVIAEHGGTITSIEIVSEG